MVASFTEKNEGKRRIVFGKPLGCPIWDETNLIYAGNYAELRAHLNEVLVQCR
jgi:hypothetical protein